MTCNSEAEICSDKDVNQVNVRCFMVSNTTFAGFGVEIGEVEYAFLPLLIDIRDDYNFDGRTCSY